jgi:uncharacterized protein (DUF983 family)
MTSVWDEIIKEAENENGKGEDSCKIRVGNPCPNCGQANLEYNGLLSLVCPHCGLEINGGFT